MTARDAYTVQVVRQDYANQIGTPPESAVMMLRSYREERGRRLARALRANGAVGRFSNWPGYGNTDAELEALLARL